MYYNPDTKETKTLDEIKALLHSSIPEGTESIKNWHLIDQALAYPSLEPDQFAVPSTIEERDGKYVQTYSVREHPASLDDSDRMKTMESAILELAQLVSRLEERRIMQEGE